MAAWRAGTTCIAAELSEERARVSTKARPIFWVKLRARVLFLCSLVFCAGVIGGFVAVGQMLKEYGSCTLNS